MKPFEPLPYAAFTQKKILPATNDFSEQMFSKFLKHHETEVARAVQCSEMLKGDLENFGDIKLSLARSLSVATSKIHFYGSRVIGVANANSDLDIYVEMQDTYYNGLAKEQQQLYIDQFKLQLHSNSDWKVGIAIHEATVPILHLVYVPRDIKCEITVGDGLGVETSKVMAHLFDVHPNAIKFFHFIRKWLLCTDVKFKGFQMALLVISFLQTRRFIPPLVYVQKKLPIIKIKGWQVQFDQNRRYDLLNEWIYFNRFVFRFFKYYETLNYDHLIIFPYLGVPVPKMNFAHQKYFKKFPNEKIKFKSDLPMSMAGPLTFDYNVTQDVTAKKLEKFQQLCEFSKQFFTNKSKGK